MGVPSSASGRSVLPGPGTARDIYEGRGTMCTRARRLMSKLHWTETSARESGGIIPDEDGEAGW